MSKLPVSVVISAYNAGPALRDCLDALAPSRAHIKELIVVNDASTDNGHACATEFGARLINLSVRRGPAYARNVGAQSATGDLVLLLDSDVCAKPDTVLKVIRRFEDDTELGAVFGSYDMDPWAPGLVSQFRNLLHCFIHQTSARRASTFWSGCGAIRRQLFIEHGGFDPAYPLPSVEDIEFGIRLSRAGVRIELDPSIQVKHLKRWTLRKMIRTDIWLRAYPWTRLILKHRSMPDELNLRMANRISVGVLALTCALSGLIAIRAVSGSSRALPFGVLALAGELLAGIIVINWKFYRFLKRCRNAWFAARCVPVHLIFYLCCCTGFGLGLLKHCEELVRLPGRLVPEPPRES